MRALWLWLWRMTTEASSRLTAQLMTVNTTVVKITLATSGATDIEVKVTAEDGVASATYEITVSKDAPDPSATTHYFEKAERDGGQYGADIELCTRYDMSYPGNVAARTSSVRVDAVASNSRADVEVTTDSTGTVTGSGPYTARLKPMLARKRRSLSP